MSDKLPISEAVEAFDMRILRKHVLSEHIKNECTTDYGEHIAATFALHHDLYCSIMATAEIHGITEQPEIGLIDFILAQIAVNAVILCGDWPDDLILLQTADSKFRASYQEAMIEMDKKAQRYGDGD